MLTPTWQSNSLGVQVTSLHRRLRSLLGLGCISSLGGLLAAHAWRRTTATGRRNASARTRASVLVPGHHCCCDRTHSWLSPSDTDQAGHPPTASFCPQLLGSACEPLLVGKAVHPPGRMISLLGAGAEGASDCSTWVQANTRHMAAAGRMLVRRMQARQATACRELLQLPEHRAGGSLLCWRASGWGASQ